MSTVIWLKPDYGEYRSHRYFTGNHETLIWAAKSADSNYFFNHELMKNWRKNYRQPCTCAHCGKINEVELLHTPGQQLGSVWAIPKTPPWEKSFGAHPTQKPLDLLVRVIYASTREGDLVLDPFCGTGTTGIAAHKCKRRFIGVDFTQSYLDIALRRFQHLAYTNSTSITTP